MEFSRNPTERFKTLPAVYMAIKMSQLKVPLELNVHSAEEIEGKVQGTAVSKLRNTRYLQREVGKTAHLLSHVLTRSNRRLTAEAHRKACCVSKECCLQILVSSPLVMCPWARDLTSLNPNAFHFHLSLLSSP